MDPTTAVPAGATARAALSLLAMLAFCTQQGQGFNPSVLVPQRKATMMLPFSRTGNSISSSSISSPTVMSYQPSGRVGTDSVTHKRQQDDGGTAGSSSSPATTFPFSGMLTECPLQIEDPDMRETDTGYTLTFKLPPDVTEEGLDVSVSGRLLTIEIRVTREQKPTSGEVAPGASDQGGGGGGQWVSRSIRTHSAARSFVLPDGVSNQVAASWVSDHEVEVKLEKVAPGAEEAIAPVTDDSAAMEDSGRVSVEDKREPTIPSSPAEAYLSGLKGILGSVGMRDSSSDPLAEAEGSIVWPGHHSRHRSLLAALDEEFRDLAKEMWDNAVRFPTEEQVAATVAKAREERAKRVTAMRRVMMATDVSETERSYVVRVALPEGATRDNVKLVVTPEKALRITFSAEGRRAISKDVRLPWDAIFSDITASFSAEQEKTEGDTAAAAPAGTDAAKSTEGGVSSLKVVVGRAPPLLPKDIDIQ